MSMLGIFKKKEVARFQHLDVCNIYISSVPLTVDYTNFNSILCLGIYMSVIKPSICFSKRIISAKWRNKLLIHNINLTVHRKSACCLRLLVFLETWVVAPFWHWRSKAFPNGRCHHDLKTFCESGHNLFNNIIENMK